MRAPRPAPPVREPARRAGRNALTRKLIHASVSLAAAAVVWALPHVAATAVLAAATLVALLIELARQAHPGFASRFLVVFGAMLRHGEARRLTGATTLALGYTAAVALFPGWPAVAAILVTGIADPAAALVGRRFGRRRYPGGKTLEGSLAFLVVAVPLLLLVPGVEWVGALAAGTALALCEAPTFRLDDNLYLPILAAFAVAVATGASPLGGFS